MFEHEIGTCLLILESPLGGGPPLVTSHVLPRWQGRVGRRGGDDADRRRGGVLPSRVSGYESRYVRGRACGCPARKLMEPSERAFLI